ncbi:hypothetical protein ACSFBF_14215 [Variovorax sp. ZT5P49]|uniref:hypothetical protein n=1 Tax=Variovorax sp. ZT5P49 TaxID=3443733 RepID=UPI003F452B54
MVDAFLIAAEAWLCNGYWVDIRYVAERGSSGITLWQASIYLSPVRPNVESNFQIDTPRLVAGQVQRLVRRKTEVLGVLRDAIGGRIDIHDHQLRLRVADYSSEMSFRDRWYSTLHLSMVSDHTAIPLSTDLAEVDNALRMHELPFDGLVDLCGWLGLQAPEAGAASQIQLRLSPPCDLIIEMSSLRQNRFKLTLHAHSTFDTSRMDVAIRVAPSQGLVARRQVANQVRWRRPKNGLRVGVAEIEVTDADSVLAMLMIGGTNVRRQWFSDPDKARNIRLLTMQHFDKDLRMVRSAVFDAPESAKFERGVAALLFLLGFTPVIPLETDSPDIVAATLGGRVVIVECTTRVADFASKIGKLVDRRTSMVRALTENRHLNPVSAALVCRIPREQIANQDQALRHGVILIASEDLANAFNRIFVPGDPDALLTEALARLPEGPAVR